MEISGESFRLDHRHISQPKYGKKDWLNNEITEAAGVIIARVDKFARHIELMIKAAGIEEFKDRISESHRNLKEKREKLSHVL